MRNHLAAGLVVTTLFTAACDMAGSATLETDAQLASYRIGRDIGGGLAPAEVHLDQPALLRGVRDAIAGRDSPVADSVLQGALERFSATVQTALDAERNEVAEQNRSEGQNYMASNAERDEVTTTASGLQWEVVEEGSGARPVDGDQVTIDYRGTLIDGTQFDSSYDRGQPLTLGVNQFVAGFTEGLKLMPQGSHYRFVIPGDLAYGAQGSPPTIGPSATLIFEVELHEVTTPEAPAP